MVEQEIKETVDLIKVISERFQKQSEIINRQDFGEVTNLERDLLITEANALQTLIGIMTVRTGLLMSNMERKPDHDGTENDDKPDEQKEETPA